MQRRGIAALAVACLRASLSAEDGMRRVCVLGMASFAKADEKEEKEPRPLDMDVW